MGPKTKTIIFIILSFVLGGFAEGVILYYHGGNSNVPARRYQTQADFRKAFAERLKLDPKQVVVIDSIVNIYRGRMNFHRQQILAVRDTLRLEIRKQINPEQNRLYDEIVREIDEREARQHPVDSTKK
jgi:hypothetical protein